MAERDNSVYEEKVKETITRENSELARFKKLYNFDLNNQKKIKKIYDLIIDTTELTIEEIVEIILSALKKKKIIWVNQNQK